MTVGNEIVYGGHLLLDKVTDSWSLGGTEVYLRIMLVEAGH